MAVPVTASAGTPVQFVFVEILKAQFEEKPVLRAEQLPKSRVQSAAAEVPC
jgi:hypothetical protein